MKGCYLKDGTLNLFGDVSVCINEYLKQAPTISFENELEKKIASLQKDDIFKLFSITLDQPGKRYGFEFFCETDIFIQVRYKVLKKVSGLRIGFDVIDKESDVIIFRTFHDDLNEKIDAIDAGEYYSKMIIPAHLFKQGVYILKLIVGIHNDRWILFDEIIIEANIINMDGINRMYADHRPGLILPYIQWETNIN